MPLFSLGSRQGVLFFCLRVEKYGEVFTDLLIPLCQQIFGAGANHYPVTFHDRIVKQRIAHCAANEVDIHQVSLQRQWSAVIAGG